LNKSILSKLLPLLLALAAWLGASSVVRAQEGGPPYRVFLPLTLPASALCERTGATYQALTVEPPPTDRPAAQHPDLNLALRGYAPATAPASYIWINGPTDPDAPLLSTLFAPARQPPIEAVSRVNTWDWAQDRHGEPIADPPVTLIWVDAQPDERLYLPNSGYDLGQGFEALVLYAERHRITLKYTREDNVVWGYTLHLENVCVDPDLLALYRRLDAAGRAELPALHSGQPFARAMETPPGVAIRDTGRFMDPRSLKDWWR